MSITKSQAHLVRIGIAQLQNTSNWDRNFRKAIATINHFARNKVDLVCFQEAFLSGYFASVIEKDYAPMQDYLDRIRAHAYKKDICVMMPSLSKRNDKLYNSIFVYSSDKGDSILHKKGLTEAEATVMKPGGGPRTFQVNGYKFGVIICREINDKHYSYLNKNQMPDMLLWPAVWGMFYHSSWTTLDPENPKWNKAFAKVAKYKIPMALINLSHQYREKTGELKKLGKSYCVSAENKVVAVGAYGKPDRIVLQLQGKKLTKIGNI
ncbi:MAG: carbon-nitrogen hydrolase family protein [Gammaproteobacteria bacterium]|nr:carbon-nitrogen hydrolase family protein [Gammaproteobacteria bacterium]